MAIARQGPKPEEPAVDLGAAGDRVERHDRHAHPHPADEPHAAFRHVAHVAEPRLELARDVGQRPVLELGLVAGHPPRGARRGAGPRRSWGRPRCPGRAISVGHGRVVVVRAVADRELGPPDAAVDDRVDAGLGGIPVADGRQRMGEDRQPEPVGLLDRRAAGSSEPVLLRISGSRSACSRRPTR